MKHFILALLLMTMLLSERGNTMVTNQSLYFATEKASKTLTNNPWNKAPAPTVPSWIQNYLTPQVPVAKTQNPLVSMSPTTPTIPSWVQNYLTPQVPVAKTKNPLLTLQPNKPTTPTQTLPQKIYTALYPNAPGVITNPTPPPDKGERQPFNLGKDSLPFKDWYSSTDPTTGKKNSDYFDSLSPEEQAALIDTVNGWTDGMLQDSLGQYNQMQKDAANAAEKTQQSAINYYKSLPSLPTQPKTPFSSSYPWTDYGSGGGGYTAAAAAPYWLSNLTNWNIS
jgi:hypothetical protein